MKLPLKYKVALVVTSIVIVMTILAGIIAEIRISSLFKRTLVSIPLGFLVGYSLGYWLEQRLKRLLLTSGQNLDVTTNPLSENLKSFDPFTADDFERIERK